MYESPARMSYTTTNPATGETLRTFALASDADIDAALDRAVAAFERHRQTTFADRAAGMRKVADLLDSGKADHARLMTLEMGKPSAQAVSEVEKCAWVCRYYAEHAEAFLADEPAESDGSRAFVAYQPLGPVLAIMPWNFPMWQAFRFAAPGVMAGNVGVLKHASNVPQCAQRIASLFHEAGFETGVFQNLFLSNEQATDIIADDRIRAVTLTGSVRAGRAVAAAAGAALKPTVLELGGSDPFLVLPDADLDAAVETAVQSRTQNNGQSCIAAKRFIVHADVAAAFTRRLVAQMDALTMGDPADEATDIGPMARADLRNELHDQVQRTIEAGATCATGGERPTGPGYYYPPTVLTDVRPGMPAFDEELFGPVAAVIVADSEADALTLANNSDFGLGSAVFTRDTDNGERIARQLEAGGAFVNGMVKSDPRLPFGGIKNSGYGRELARHGIREFVNAKTVWIA